MTWIRFVLMLYFFMVAHLVLANTFGHHKASRRWTWHSPNGQHHNKIDYILLRKRFRSGVNIPRTRSFPGADIGCDHDFLMMTFRLRLKKISKPKHTRLKFDLEKLKDPNVLETFQAMIGGRFASLAIMSNEDTDIDSMITTFNTAVTETASEILGKHRQKKIPWITAEILDLCDKRRELRKNRFEPEGSEKYKEVNNNIKRCTKKAKENWIGEQCSETEENLRKNNSKRAYQLVKDLTTVKQRKATTVQDRSRKCLTEERQILNRWTEYCSELYNYKANGDPSVLNCPHTDTEDDYPVLSHHTSYILRRKVIHHT